MNENSDFQYLTNAAKKYGRSYLTEDLQHFSISVTPEQLSELTQAYEEICKRQHNSPLSEFVRRYTSAGSGAPRSTIDIARQIRQLFVLFRYLGDSGISPFCSRRVEYVERPRIPNWDTIPEELGYLRDAAEKYGIGFSEHEILNLLDSLNDEELDQLAGVAERMRIYGHQTTIDAWLDQHPMTEHDEAWMIYSLLLLHDHADLL